MTSSYRPLLPIALVGFMGAGKSTLGRRLASTLQLPFWDLDEEVERGSGKTIPELFRGDGEESFRRLESDLLEVLLQKGPAVIALGGGVLGRRENLEAVLRHSHLIYLRLPWPRLSAELDRLRGGRPMLQERSPLEVRELFEQREPFYLQAHLTVDIRHDSIEADLERIANALGRET